MMSIVRRGAAFSPLRAPQLFTQRWLSGAFQRFGLSSVPLSLIMIALALIVVGAGTFLIFKSRDGTRTNLVATDVPVATAMPTNAGDANGGPDPIVNWDRLEPAYRSYKIQVGNDNSLQTNQQAIELYGLQILPRSQICTYRSGERWACGQRAYVALLNIFSRSTVDCRPHRIDQPRLVSCQLGGRDIGELMLREGWANLAAGAVAAPGYAEAAAIATRNKAGMWSPQPAQR